jgi:hypothetical protein
MSVENWKAIFDIVGVVAVFLALVAGAGVLWTGNIINERQSAQLRAFDKGLTDAKIELGKQQERAASAEKALRDVSNVAGDANERAARANEEAARLSKASEELKQQNLETESHLEQERIKRLELEGIVAPRSIRLTKGVVDRLERDRGTVLHIEYRRDDIEAHRFALRIRDATGWADWIATLKSSDESEFEAPLMRRFREGIEIRGAPLPRDADFSKLPRNRAAIQLWEFLRANGIEATLYADAMHLTPGEPITVRVWPKPTPHSKSARIEGFDIMGSDSGVPQKVKEQHDARERTRLEENERLRKEWYPDGYQ